MPMYIEINECLGNGTVAESVTLIYQSIIEIARARILRTAQGNYSGPFNKINNAPDMR